ncbi:transcriptional regulator, MarR family [Gemmobacter caeni]|jgi:homoprotocatechuate degradation regulator HpaR|uniref:MarR family transcriptional regulator n=2 Tax=Gemmobacter caeni TaxID=589035 RepID=A0A2T6B026_9RHOB|nr:MarR family transcriptional regulator [Gemmobacter caeni]TWJ00285.1 transcriptional regulator, MarR family [Gemmobacter caeni]
MPHSPVKDGFELSKTRRTLPMALLRAREAVMERFRPLLLAHGVTEQQWRVLRVLKEAEETDASDLADAASILAPSLSRILRTLETRAFIATRKDPQDGRRALIRLTAEGHAFIRQIAPESAAIYAELEARLGRARIDALLDDLEALMTALERA